MSPPDVILRAVPDYIVKTVTVNELYISAEVSQRDISRGAVLHR